MAALPSVATRRNSRSRIVVKITGVTITTCLFHDSNFAIVLECGGFDRRKRHAEFARAVLLPDEKSLTKWAATIRCFEADDPFLSGLEIAARGRIFETKLWALIHFTIQEFERKKRIDHEGMSRA